MIGNSLKMLLTSDLPPSYSEVMLDPCKFPSYLPTMTPLPPPYSLVKDMPFPRVFSMINTVTTEENHLTAHRSSPPNNSTTATLLLTLGGVGGLVLPQVVVGVMDMTCDYNATSTWLITSSIIWSVILILGNIIIIIANCEWFSEFFIISNIVLLMLWVYGFCTVYSNFLEEEEGKSCICPLSFYMAWGYIMVQGALYGGCVVGIVVLGFWHLLVVNTTG